MLPTDFSAQNPDDIVRVPLEPRFTQATYAPATIAVLNGSLLWGGSRIYGHRFGIGINEWRLLGTLSDHPGNTAAECSVKLGMNKAIVSQSIARLRSKGLVIAEVEGRARRLYLTQAGADMFHAIRPIAEERENILLRGLKPHEIASLRALLVKMVAQVDELRRYDHTQLVDSDRYGATDEE
jgi:DNA-binding MarR family transcriptional regulator